MTNNTNINVVTATANAWRRAVARANLAVWHKGNTSLQNLHVSAGDGGVVVTGTNTERAVVADVEGATAATSAPFLVNARALAAALKALPGDAFVTLTGQRVPAKDVHDMCGATLTCDDVSLRLETGRVEDFPELPSRTARDEAVRFTLPAAELRDMLGRVAFAMSTEAFRYYLNGALLHTTATGQMRLVATDGHRLVVTSRPAPSGATRIPGPDTNANGQIIPAKTVHDLVKLLAKQPGNVTVTVSSLRLTFAAAGWSLLSKAVDGWFPEYERVIPLQGQHSPAPTTLLVDGMKLKAAVKAATAGNRDASKATRLDMEPGADGGLRVVCAAIESSAQVLGAEVRGAPLSIGFQASYIVDFADNAPPGRLVWHFAASAEEPVRVTVEGRDDWVGVIMPRRV